MTLIRRKKDEVRMANNYVKWPYKDEITIVRKKEKISLVNCCIEDKKDSSSNKKIKRNKSPTIRIK